MLLFLTSINLSSLNAPVLHNAAILKKLGICWAGLGTAERGPMGDDARLSLLDRDRRPFFGGESVGTCERKVSLGGTHVNDV